MKQEALLLQLEATLEKVKESTGNLDGQIGVNLGVNSYKKVSLLQIRFKKFIKVSDCNRSLLSKLQDWSPIQKRIWIKPWKFPIKWLIVPC